MENRKVNLMYVGAAVDIKTKKGSIMHIINLLEIGKDKKTEKLIGTENTSFYWDDSDKPFVQEIVDKGFEYGDIVECEFTMSESLSRPPELSSINKLVAASPFRKLIFNEDKKEVKK